MTQEVNSRGLTYFQLDLGGICYLGFDLSSVLNSLPENLKIKCLTQ